MKAYELNNAPPSLETLVKEARAGEEILITEHQQPVAKLVPVAKADRARPMAGSMRGEVWMAADFNAPVPDFKEYME